MTLRRDLRSPTVLRLKGLMFFLIAALASGLLIERLRDWRGIVLLGIALWAACRFYYFLFYVLEHYGGSQHKYAGILDAAARLLPERKR